MDDGFIFSATTSASGTHHLRVGKEVAGVGERQLVGKKPFGWKFLELGTWAINHLFVFLVTEFRKESSDHNVI